MKFKIKVLDIKNFSSFLFIGIICLLFIFQGCEKEKDDVLSAVEKEWLAHHKEIRIAPDPNFPPIEYFDTSGVYR